MAGSRRTSSSGRATKTSGALPGPRERHAGHRAEDGSYPVGHQSQTTLTLTPGVGGGQIGSCESGSRPASAPVTRHAAGTNHPKELPFADCTPGTELLANIYSGALPCLLSSSRRQSSPSPIFNANCPYLSNA